ncbi:MAG TPA: DUF6152 family protein [Caulobacteraceae bacterium]|jgi:hypothetical protein|nr:DUF6152 family protein [Caulobacteraceae bacterium]
MRWTGALPLAAALAAAAPALAHHSIAAVYDRDKSVEMQGVLSKVSLQNPHSVFELTVAEGSGKTTVWMLESRGVQGMTRIGLEAHAVAVGDRVTVKGAPARHGEHQLWLSSLKTASGKLFEIDNRAAQPFQDPQVFRNF